MSNSVVYDIAGVLHPSKHTPQDLLDDQGATIRSLSGQYDVLFYEDGVEDHFDVPGRRLDDSVIYWLYGLHSYRLGQWLNRFHQRFTARRWAIRSLQDTHAKTEKAYILDAQRELWSRCHSYDQLAYSREWERSRREFWPLAFPDHQPNVTVALRSQVQARTATLEAEAASARAALVVVGEAHEPEVARELLYPSAWNPDPLIWHLPMPKLRATRSFQTPSEKRRGGCKDSADGA